MINIILRPSKISILTRESDEIHVVRRLVSGIMLRKSHDCRRTGSVVIGTGIEHFAAQIPEVVIVRREHIATVVAGTLHFSDDIEALVIIKE